MDDLKTLIAETIREHTAEASWTPEGLAEAVLATHRAYDAELRQRAEMVVGMLFPKDAPATTPLRSPWDEMLSAVISQL